MTRSRMPGVVTFVTAALALVLGLLSVINPVLAVIAACAILAVAAFTHNAAVAVYAFAAATYFEIVTAYVGESLSPIKLAGGALVVLAAAKLLTSTRVRRDIRADRVAHLLAGGAGWNRHPVIVAFLAALLAWAAASAAWATNIEQVKTLGIRLMLDALVFLAVPLFLQRTDQLRLLGWVMLASASVATLLGTIIGAEVFGRAIGTFADPNEYAAALVPAMAFGIALSETATNMSSRIAGRLGVLICLFGLVSSGSRGGLIAAVAAFMALLVTARGRERVRLSGVLCVAIATGAAWLALTPAGSAIMTRITDNDSSGRTDLWHVAVQQWKDYPITGVGLGNYPVLSRQYLDSSIEDVRYFLERPRVVHSTPLELLAELGTVGFALYYGFVLGCIIAAVRALRIARRIRDERLVGAARGIVAATLATLATTVFLSGQYQELAWVLFGACISVHTAAQRASALDDAARTLDDDSSDARASMSGGVRHARLSA